MKKKYFYLLVPFLMAACTYITIPDKDDEISIEMVYVKGGTFTMGCTDEQGSDCYEGEKPAHQVTLNSFYIGKYEVTTKEWNNVMSDNSNNGGNVPVDGVRWNDIVGTSGSTQVINGITYYSNGFIYKLNKKTGKKYRLPTEAEWEYAARGGAISKGYKYSGSNTADNVAWYFRSSDYSDFYSHIVGSKQANELGIYDMSGNVWEWCSDWYGDYSSTAQFNPVGPALGYCRVVRGGCFNDFVGYARVSSRNNYAPDVFHCGMGFRLASSSN
jgi:formylglycine-generating enzyme required for sulfatase activity